MTRLAVLADIHGNLPALQAVIDDMQPFAIDHVLVAGDSVNWGPFSRQVLELITARRWAVLRGNNEFYLLDYATKRAPKHWDRFTMPAFIHAQLGSHWLNVLASLPDSLSLRFRDAPPIRAFHGIPGDPWTAINPASPAKQVQTWLGALTGGAVIGAHSHIALERRVAGWQIFNPGSVGVPLDGDFSASYMILQGQPTGWQLIEHRRVAFDYAPIYAEFERQGFVEHCGVAAQLVVDEFRTARLQVHPYQHWKQTHHPQQPDSWTLLDEFRQCPDISAHIPPAYRHLQPRLHRDPPVL